jgi:hypothetical protein
MPCLYIGLTQLTAQVNRPIGTNLAGLQDWSSEYVFVDVFKMSREWIAHEDGWDAPWSSQVEIPFGPNGYPAEIPYDNGEDPPQLIRTLMYFGELNGKYPSGMYRLIASGSGQIRLWGAASGTFQCPVDVLVPVNSENGGIALEIERSEKVDPVRDIRFIMPGHHDTCLDEPFHPDFLEFLQDFQVIRFMDWMKTNGSPVEEGADRTATTHYTQTLAGGIAYEYITELCNRLEKDAWICIPHRASDDYLYQLAGFFKDRLDPGLKLYIEYSNEVWNGIFSQNHYAQQQGAALGYPGQPWEQGWRYYVKRTHDIFDNFEEVFEDDDRLVKILSGQSANRWLNNRLLEYSLEDSYNPNQNKADAFGIAPYFGGSVADAIGDAGLTATITVEAILDSMEQALPGSFSLMEENKEVASNYDMDLVCYEAGQHLVASHLYNNDEAYVQKLTDANRHPRMKELYCAYFDHWYDEAGGGLLCNFSSHGTYSKWGSWGVKEFMDEWEAPKYLALKECVFDKNLTTLKGETKTKVNGITIYPNPFGKAGFRIQGLPDGSELNIHTLTGELVKSIIAEPEIPLDLNLEHTGIYLLVIKGKRGYQTFTLIRM